MRILCGNTYKVYERNKESMQSECPYYSVFYMQTARSQIGAVVCEQRGVRTANKASSRSL